MTTTEDEPTKTDYRDAMLKVRRALNVWPLRQGDLCDAVAEALLEVGIEPHHEHNPRKDADDAYLGFLSMGDSEWQGVLKSVLHNHGVLEPEEQKGFVRAINKRGLK